MNSIFSLVLCLGVVGFQDAPKTILEVKGSKAEAARILKAQGIDAVELRGSTYVLPTVDIVSQEEVDPGEMIVVSANLDRTKFPEGLVQVKFQWTVVQDGKPKDNVIVWPDGSKLFFAAGMKPATYNVFLDVDCLFGTQQTVEGKSALVNPEIDSPEISVKTIKVGGGAKPEPDVPNPPPPTPPNPDPPTPKPDPEPTFDPGKYGISKMLYDYMKTYEGLTGEEKYKVSQALKVTYETVSSQIAALSQMRDVNTILQTAKTLANDNLASSGVPTSKIETLKSTMSGYLYTLYQNGTCRTAEDFKAAADEAAKGFAAIPKK